MASCKDCVHYEVCQMHYKQKCELTYETEREVEIAMRKAQKAVDIECDYYKDRARFVELPCAEWIEDEDMYDEPIFRCSNCNERFVLEEGTPLDNCYFYCPNCGAKMDEQDLKKRESNG